MTVEQLLAIVFVGLVASFLASRLVTGHGFGVAGDIVLGLRRTASRSRSRTAFSA
jgi:uncharacterized membrane protein YeaQ/YmgE (transglycosylase-associated protein family)